MRFIFTCATLVRVFISCRRMSVCPSITSQCSKRRITQTVPHDSPGTLVFGCLKSRQNSNGVTTMEAPNAGGVG